MGVNNSDIILIEESQNQKRLATFNDSLINQDRGVYQYQTSYETAVNDLQDYIKTRPEEFVLQIHVLFKTRLTEAESVALSGSNLAN